MVKLTDIYSSVESPLDNQEILQQIDDEAIFIPISHGRMTVVAPNDLEKLSFTQSQYELPFNEMQFK